jgi:hypothetical protein
LWPAELDLPGRLPSICLSAVKEAVMHDVLIVLAVIAVVAFVIVRRRRR